MVHTTEVLTCTKMWDVKACRSCLTVKGKLEKIGDASKRQYSAITGLPISEKDGYPSYFCVECRHHIRKSLAFRRKSRRAHFVLKEIMTVRKQISYSDIVTVDRKKTNLESSLSFWEPSNNSCFLIANEEGQEEDSMKKYDLEEPQTRLHSIKISHFPSHSKHLVEITPDKDTEPPVESNEQDEDLFKEDIPTNNYPETTNTSEPEPEIDTSNIDMNDIFKDLTENEKSDDNDDFLEPLPVDSNSNKPISRKTEPPKVIKSLEITKHYSITTVIHSLVLYDLTVLSLEKQKETFELRKRIGPFAKALYKCAMCLSIHKDMDHLVTHVKYHNERKYGNECQVCKNKFPTEEVAVAHVATCHLYEYNCRICCARVYSQMDAVKHAKEFHSRDDPTVNSYVIKRRQERKMALSNFTITTLSQRMMSEVMLLRSRPEQKKPREPDEVKPGQDCSFKCDVCGIGLKFRHSLEKHMVLRHRYMYTCKICKEIFTTRMQALQHNEETHMKHRCEECGKVFGKMKKLKAHLSSTHTKKIPCNLCGYSANTEKYYYKHQLLEHGYVSINDPLLGDPQYRCITEECGVQFADKRAMEVHLVNMHHAGAENIPYACVPCRKLYANAEELDTHFITCRETNKYPRTCCYCPEVLRTSLQYKLHYIHEHPTLPYRYASQNAICDICGKSVFKPTLEAHLRIHAGAAYECRLCSTVNSTPAQHITHLLSNHMHLPYKCSLCANRFKFRASCKHHILKIHAPTKLFKCEFCAAEFSDFRRLKQHAEKLHDLAIAPIKPKIPPKSKTKIYVYAHMKIIINEREREAVEKLNLELIDYLEQKSKPVNCNDYFIFNPFAEEIATYKKKKKKKRKSKKQNEVEAAVAQITVEWTPDSGVKIEKSEVSEDINGGVDMEVDKLEIIDMPVEVEINEKPVDADKLEINEKPMDVDTKPMDVDTKPLDVDTKPVDVDTKPVDADMLEMDEKPLEVIESDGQQYVMINGELYRIAAEDDE